MLSDYGKGMMTIIRDVYSLMYIFSMLFSVLWPIARVLREEKCQPALPYCRLYHCNYFIRFYYLFIVKYYVISFCCTTVGWLGLVNLQFRIFLNTEKC